MNHIFLIIIVFILLIYIRKTIAKGKERRTYLKAGKKWDEIVNELSRK